MPPFALAAIRFLLAAVPVVFFVKRPSMPAWSVIAYGAAIGIFQFGLLFLGIKLGMPAGLSSLVIQVQVFFTIGLAVIFAGDRLQRHHLIGAGIAALGVIVLAAHKLALGMAGTFVGFLLVIGAAVAWAAGNIIAKRGAGDHGADMFALVVWSSLVPPLPLAALSYAFEGGARCVPRGGRDERHGLGLRADHGVCRDAFRLRIVERAVAPLSDGADLAVRAAHSGHGHCKRRAVSWRIARAAAGRRCGAGVGRPRDQRLRAEVARLARARDVTVAGRQPVARRCFLAARWRSITGTTIAMPISVPVRLGATIPIAAAAHTQRSQARICTNR